MDQSENLLFILQEGEGYTIEFKEKMSDLLHHAKYIERMNYPRQSYDMA